MRNNILLQKYKMYAAVVEDKVFAAKEVGEC